MHLTFIHGIEKFTLLDHYFFICLAEYLDRNSDPLDITYGFYTVALLVAAGVFAFISSDKLKLLEKTSQDSPWGLYDHSLRAI